MNIFVPYFFLLPFPTPNKSVHSTAWTLWSLGRHRLPAPQWVRLHYCHIMAGAAPAIDVATTLYKAAQSPGGRHRLRDARMGRMADPFGAGSRCRSYFPVNQLIELQYSVLLAAAPALPSPFQGLTHSSARSRGHPIVAVVQCDWTNVCYFALSPPLRFVWHTESSCLCNKWRNQEKILVEHDFRVHLFLGKCDLLSSNSQEGILVLQQK